MSTVEVISFLDQPANYATIWKFQKSRLSQIASNIEKETLVFCEHERLLTLGRRSKAENILDQSIPVYSIERGGDVTLHAPGQLVVYPLLKLNSGRFPGGLHDYLRFLEEVTIGCLQFYEVEAGRFGPTGVWIRRASGEVKKIASIGIAVRRWVTYHGLSINVSNDLSDFKKLRPCDFDSSIMTSLHEEGIDISLKEFSERLKRHLVNALEMRAQASVRDSLAVHTNG